MATAKAKAPAAAGSTESAAVNTGDTAVAAASGDAAASGVDTPTNAAGTDTGTGDAGAANAGDTLQGANGTDTLQDGADTVSEIDQQTGLAAQPFPTSWFEQIAPTYPRLVAIVNDTPILYVIAGKDAKAHSTSDPILVNSVDEVTRMKTDCAQIVALNNFSGDEPALRVIDVD